jgi:hypothetical protein
MACILVDMQAVNRDQVRTLADERNAGLRPYWVIIRAQQILRARGVNIGGRLELARFAYIETSMEADGAFGEREVTRIRDYERTDSGVVCTIYTKQGKENTWTSEVIPMSISRIPVAPAYSNRIGFFHAEPPLLDLALENIDHYQTRSDRKSVLHGCVPTLILSGTRKQDDTSLRIGVNSCIEMQDGTGAYVEPSGSSLTHSREELQDIEQRMAALGLSMLQRQTRSAETAEAKRIDKSESDSQLAAVARGVEDAGEAALGFHTEWVGLPDGGSMEIDKSFISEPMDPQLLQVLVSMVPNSLSLDTLWERMVAGGILGDSFNPEIERERLESDPAESLMAVRSVMRAEKPEVA